MLLIIGKNVSIDPFVVIHKNVIIGEGTWIGSNVTIMSGARIGRNCKIFSGAVIGGEPQDLKFAGEETTAEIGDNTIIREHVTINRGTKEKWKTVIGSGCLIMAYSHIAHDCQIGSNCVFFNCTTLAGHVIIGNNVILGHTVAIHQFVMVGNYALISDGALVRKDVPPYVRAAREPLSYLGINSEGMHQGKLSKASIIEIKQIYYVLFILHNNITKALDIIETTFKATEFRDEILDFIRKSNRGIIRGLGMQS
ncbi:MAG: acyl-ACP--UDP-N-acetylglucosamine O-acyltransferase [Flavobacteriales bacterium]|nr:MAG: acyl-ACP--UDP-N-acetylglucosamine O-acyltransferase [Flavobacteriales bacterium]